MCFATLPAQEFSKASISVISGQPAANCDVHFAPKIGHSSKEKTAFSAVFSGLGQFEALHAIKLQIGQISDLYHGCYSQYLQGGKSRP
jgi:hypothetical protein